MIVKVIIKGKNTTRHLLLQVEDLVEEVLELEVEGVHLPLARRSRLARSPRPQLRGRRFAFDVCRGYCQSSVWEVA